MVDENQQIAQRRAKLTQLRQSGQAFPNDFRRQHLARDIQHYADQEPETLEHQAIVVHVAGRMMTRRIMGKAAFVHLQDMSGQIQLYVKRDELPEQLYQTFKQWDLGDIVAASGSLFKTKTGELSVKVTMIRLLTKALRPLPEKFHGLVDAELRARQRYLDLIVNERTRLTFARRSAMIAYVRQFLLDRGFMEVETPMMHAIPGGAAARPFITHHNALDMPLYLRIAPELYLKQLVVGGFERVFEINRNFRNEGVSTQHNPEFTMLEFYQAYADYQVLMDLTETLLRGLTQAVLGATQIVYQGETYDFGKPFVRMTLLEAIMHFNPQFTEMELQQQASLTQMTQQLGITAQGGVGKLQLELFEKTVEHQLKQPTFITAYPTEVSPLARVNDHDPTVTDRFELFIGGREIANGFSELNDAEEQAERFCQQAAAQAAGDEEAMHYDADYIRALEYGLPPTAGEGIGIDRLVMLLTDQQSIREVLLFPHMRMKASE